MPRSVFRRIVSALVGAGAVLVLVGCASGPTRHEDAVNTADARWKQLRSSQFMRMAQQQFDTGDLDQAEKTLLEAISVDAANPHLHILAGRLALERGQLERAYQRLDLARELDEKLSPAAYYQGIVLQRWKKFDLALQCYEQAYELEPDNVAYLLAVGEMLVALDRSGDAVARLKDKADYFAQNAGIRAAIAQLHAMRKEYERAAWWMRQASLLAPDDAKLREDLAMLQLSAGQTDEAIESLEGLCAAEMVHERRDLFVALAAAYQQAGRPGEARKAYLKLTRANPRDADAWLALGELAWAGNDLGSALTAAQRVMAVAPKRHEGFLLAGMVWQKRGRHDDALRHFDRAARLAPHVAEPAILRGITLEQAGRLDAAAEAYAEALRRQPDDPRARTLLARVTRE